MKKVFACILIVLLLAAGVFVSNNFAALKANSLVDTMGITEVPEGASAVILNNPSEQQLAKAGKYQKFELNPGEKVLLIPVYAGAEVNIKKVDKILESGEIEAKESLYTAEKVKRGYSLLIDSIRPEGMPQFIIEVNGKKYTSRYIYSYNGKDGHPDVEYIISEELSK